MDRRSRSIESRQYKRKRRSRSRSNSHRERGYYERDRHDRERYERVDRDRQRERTERRRRSRSRSSSRSRERGRRGQDRDRDLYRELIDVDYDNNYKEMENRRREKTEHERNYERCNARGQSNQNQNSNDNDVQVDSNEESFDGFEQNNSSEIQRQRTIIVQGLSPNVTESDIICDLKQCNLKPIAIRLKSRRAGTSRGFAFVDFATQDEAMHWIRSRKGVIDLPNCRAKLQYSIAKFLTDWYCVKCGILNFRRRDVCFRCNASREESEKGEGCDQVSDIATKKIMFRNLDVLTTEEKVATTLQERIPQEIVKVSKIMICREISKISRGICFLYFDNLSDSVNTFNALKKLEPALNIDGREVSVTYCVDTENKQIFPKPSKPASLEPTGKYPANTYQYTLADVPRLAEYSASLYASTLAEREHYIKYYTNYYITEITNGQYSNLPTMSQVGETSANSGAAVALCAIQRKLSKTVKINSSLEKNFDKTYPAPDTTTYQYDETSGYYYDPLTKLYYDPHSQYYYDNETGSYMYYNQEQRKYVLAPTASQVATTLPSTTGATEAVNSNNETNSGSNQETATDGDVKPKDEPKKETKYDKVKVAKKIAKDMEKWAKQLNQKKELTFSTSVGTTSVAPIATPIIDVKKSHTLSSKYADVGFSILEGNDKQNLTNKIETEISTKIIQSYNSDSDEQDDIAAHSKSPDFSSEKDYVDFDQLTCLLCKRAFQSPDVLAKHLKLSKLHKDNLAKYKLNKIYNGESDSSQNYRDRAKERRLKFGEGDPPPVNRAKEKFEKHFDSVSKNVHSQIPSTPISENNVGSRLLQKMGWQEGQGLGKTNQGRTNIIEADGRSSNAGLGSKTSQFGPGDDYKSYIKRMMKSRYESVDLQK